LPPDRFVGLCGVYGKIRKYKERTVLGAGVDVGLGLLLGQEDAGGLHHVLGAHLAPGDVLGLHLGEELHLLAVDGDGVVVVGDVALELAVDGVVLQHISHIVGGHKGVVDADELDVITDNAGPENQAADPAETIDANLDAHVHYSFCDSFGVTHCDGFNDISIYDYSLKRKNLEGKKCRFEKKFL